jgi:Tfp pilus assembly protein PilF
VSLISEALKEAQRERTARAGPRAAATIVETVFPYPSSKKRAAPSRALIAAVAVAVVVIAGAALGWRWYAQRTTHPVNVRPNRVVTAPPVAPPASAPAEAKSLKVDAPASPSVSPTVSSTAAPAPSRSVAVPQKKVEIVPTQVVVKDSAAPKQVAPAAPATTPPAPAPAASAPVSSAPAVQPQGSPAAVRVVLDPSGARPSDSLFAQAYAEQRRGNLEMARDLYEKALRKPPVAPELYNNYGALLASGGNHTAAIAMYNLGLQQNQGDARLWTNLAQSLNASGRHAEAMSAYQQAAKLDPANGIVKTRLAAEYLAIGDTASARRAYEEAARTSAKDAAVHHAYGTFLVSQRDYRSAIREFQLFVDLGVSSYPASDIDAMKKYIAALRQRNP